ncbi:MAG: fatty acid desaturase, partial [Ginsengibacter sp.]
QQKWVSAHRYQFLYMFILYSLSTLFWLLIFDFERYFKRKLYTTPISKIETKDHVIFWVGKICYLIFYAVIPVLILGWLPWFIGFITLHITMGLTLTIVFQLAHIVEKTEFEQAGEEPKIINNEWAVYQVLTTADFAPGNRIVTWLVGGLNYQIEHHLFPRVSHVHYPALSRIVEENCKRFDLPYNCYPTTRAAVASHIRLMMQLGKKDFTPPVLRSSFDSLIS